MTDLKRDDAAVLAAGAAADDDDAAAPAAVDGDDATRTVVMLLWRVMDVPRLVYSCIFGNVRKVFFARLSVSR